MKSIIVFVLFGLVMAITATDSKRFKRFLIFPAATPTRMQVINDVDNGND